jgi:hypothetical protein
MSMTIIRPPLFQLLEKRVDRVVIHNLALLRKWLQILDQVVP